MTRASRRTWNETRVEMDKPAPDPLQGDPRPHRRDRRGRAPAPDRALGRDRRADRDQGHEQARRRVPARPRGRHDAPPRHAARGRAAARHGRAHLARDHHHLHRDAGAVRRRRRAGGRSARHARSRPLLFRLLGAGRAGARRTSEAIAEVARSGKHDRRRGGRSIGPMVGRRSPAPTRRKSSPSFPSSKSPTAPPIFPPT